MLNQNEKSRGRKIRYEQSFEVGMIRKLIMDMEDDEILTIQLGCVENESESEEMEDTIER